METPDTAAAPTDRRASNAVTAVVGLAVAAEPAEMATIARQAAFVGERVFAPIGLLVLGMGIAMVVNLDWARERCSCSSSRR